MTASLKLVAQSIYEKHSSLRLVIAIGTVLSITVVTYLVYITGGTRLSYLHLMYVPIIVSGLWFGLLPGFATGIVAGLAIGPLMPEDVQKQIFQGTETWSFRIGLFILLGICSGAFSKVMSVYYERLESLFYADPLTDLPNYRGLEKLVLKHQARYDGLIVVRFIQLRDVEKAFGNETFERVVIQIKDRLVDLLAPEVILGRVYDDTLVIFVPAGSNPRDYAEDLSQRLDNRFLSGAVPFLIESTFSVIDRSDFPTAFSLTDHIKIGIAGNDEGQAHHNKLVVCRDQKSVQSVRNIFILHELTRALEEDLLSLNYQPIISMQTKQVMTIEALARWSHPELGMIGPTEFMAIAERTQLINPYTVWMLDHALTQLRVWHDHGHDVNLSVNFSMKNFQDPELISFLFKKLQDNKISPGKLTVEVTESAVAEGMAQVTSILQTMRKRGIKVAIDDFGAGQSSLKYLMDLPVDIVKIDRAFIKNMLSNDISEAIIRAVIAMGQELHMQVIAEGVEQEAEALQLEKMGCHGLQGFFITRPMPEELTTSWLNDYCSRI